MLLQANSRKFWVAPRTCSLQYAIFSNSLHYEECQNHL